MQKIAISVAVLLAVTAAAAFGTEQTVTEDGYSQVVASEMTLGWRVVDENLEVVVSAPTTGWIAVGFDPGRRMKDANIIIGYVKAGAAVVRDDYGVTQTGHRADIGLDGGSADVFNIDGSEADGRTELRYTIPLDSGDKYDRALEPGQKYKVILAHGRAGADTFGAYHAFRTSIEVTL